MTYVDTTRKTNADPKRQLPERPSRTLPVMLLYPATGAPAADGTPSDGAPAAAGRFPLVVFSHGITASGPVYTVLLQRLARAGYVIAAPTFPLSGPGAQFPGDSVALGDYANQPADVRFVITKVLEQSAKRGDPLYGRVDPTEIAAAGHSLGAITTIGLVYNSCCQDPRVDAAVEISGLELPFPNGTFGDTKTPVLLIHGAKDNVVGVAVGSDKMWTEARGPQWYLRYDAGDHTNLIFSATYQQQTVDAIVAFLDAQLKRRTAALDALPAQVQASGLGTFRRQG
ncbi:MAG: phospholipase [Actinobacteria bacterium]|nr:phospholipase [Actinomycetota bacterium]